jgi:hypothetical protein|nr:MAG TPA: hypothetical protein [Caudoviricetes sp.]
MFFQTLFHKNADNMLAYAYDAKKMVDPWKRWEFSVDGGATFEPLQDNPDWNSDVIYRKRCELIKVGKHEFYRGINYELCIGQTYHYIGFDGSTFKTYVDKWTGNSSELDKVRGGFVHLTAANAARHTEVLTAISKGDI